MWKYVTHRRSRGVSSEVEVTLLESGSGGMYTIVVVAGNEVIVPPGTISIYRSSGDTHLQIFSTLLEAHVLADAEFDDIEESVQQNIKAFREEVLMIWANVALEAKGERKLAYHV